MRPHPALRIESADGTPAPRERASLVALDGGEPGAEPGRTIFPGQARGNQLLAHAADAEEIDLHLCHRARERAKIGVRGQPVASLTCRLDPLRRMDRPIKLGHDSARERFDRGGGRGIGEDRNAEAVAQRIAGARRLAGRGARTTSLRGFVGGVFGGVAEVRHRIIPLPPRSVARPITAANQDDVVIKIAMNEADALERRTLDKVTWRLVPIITVCFFIAILDRVNIGFANAARRTSVRSPQLAAFTTKESLAPGLSTTYARRHG